MENQVIIKKKIANAQIEERKTDAKRELWLDWLKGVAIVAVILIHVASVGLYQVEKIGRVGGISWSDWLATNFYSGVGRLLLPVFFMATGYLLLARREESLSDFWKKRLGKIMPIWLVWQVIYWWWVGWNTGGGWDWSWPRIWSLMTSPSYYHLWFLSALIILYLVTPILRLFLKNATQTDVFYFLGLWAVLVIGGKTMNYYLGQEIWHFNYLVEYVGYYVIGYYFYRWGKKENIGQQQREKWLGWWLAGLAEMAIVLETAWSSVKAGYFRSYTYDYLSLAVAIGSIGIFMGAQNSEKGLWGKRILGAVSKASLGIYLWHVIVLEILRQSWIKELLGVPLDGTWPNYWLGIPLVGILVVIVSFGLTKITQKIPLLKKLV